MKFHLPSLVIGAGIAIASIVVLLLIYGCGALVHAPSQEITAQNEQRSSSKKVGLDLITGNAPLF